MLVCWLSRDFPSAGRKCMVLFYIYIQLLFIYLFLGGGLHDACSTVVVLFVNCHSRLAFPLAQSLYGQPISILSLII